MGSTSQFWMQLVATVLLGGLAIRMQYKNNALVESQILAASKKKSAPRIGIFRQYWPVMPMFLLVGVSWIPHFLSTQDQAEATQPQADQYFQSWGPWPEGSALSDPRLKGKIITDGKLFHKYHDDFKLAGALFFTYPGTDIYDASGLQKSKRYEIRDEAIDIFITWDDSYRQQVIHGASGTNYALLIVPNSVDMSSFDTLHQAQALGVKVVGVRGGPP